MSSLRTWAFGSPVQAKPPHSTALEVTSYGPLRTAEKREKPVGPRWTAPSHEVDCGSMNRKQRKSDEIVVYQIVRAAKCSECDAELGKGRFLTKVGDEVLCLDCSDFAHLVYLPRGDAALTRRAGKYSSLRAVVVKFSRARRRYERQGILVQSDALEKAEEECLADAEVRAIRRERNAERLAQLDAEYVEAFARRIRSLYPSCPAGEETKVAEHACEKYSGRVGRTAEAKELDAAMIELAVTARIRHRYTDYDRLLGEGWNRHEARCQVADAVSSTLEHWRAAP